MTAPDRFSAEQILTALTGGILPEVGAGIVFIEDGSWIFAPLARKDIVQTLGASWNNTVFDNGDQNSAWTLEGDESNVQTVNLTGNCTVTLNLTEGSPLRLYISYSGAFTLTITGADYGTPGTPTWSSADALMDKVLIELIGDVITVFDAGMGYTKPT